jgi:solute carrier family 66, member 2
VFYWFGVHYDRALLIQALIMIVMQCMLLHVALTHRPAILTSNGSQIPLTHTSELDIPRPHNFWRWRTSKPYWQFLGYVVLVLLVLQLIFGHSASYAGLLGAIALAIEAILPIPQILANHRRRGCKGFRVSVLANWLVGDAFKMVFFIAKGANEVPWAFKLCGMFQAACDIYLGIQFYNFGDGEPGSEGRNLQEDVRWLKEKSLEMVGLEKSSSF